MSGQHQKIPVYEVDKRSLSRKAIQQILVALAEKERDLLQKERQLNQKLSELRKFEKEKYKDYNTTEIEKKANSLALKEKELLKKEKQIEKKYNKLLGDGGKAMNVKTQPAPKFELAKQKLLAILNTKNKSQRHSKSETFKEKRKPDIGKDKPDKKDSKPNNLENKEIKDKDNFNTRLRAMWKSMIPEKEIDVSPYPLRESFFDRTRNTPRRSIFTMCNKKLFQSNPWVSRSGPNPKSSRSNMSRLSGAGGDCLMSLRNPPQPWMQTVNHCSIWKSFGYVLLFLTAILLWTPCLLCLYLFKCCFCACCSDY